MSNEIKNVNECKIVKRNGSQVDYDRGKIERAIGLAMGETDEGLEWGKYEEMIAYIESKIVDGGDGISVEDVSDIVQRSLMKFELYDTAERYILWRRERSESRGREKYGILSKEFLSRYKHLTPPMTQLGEFVYYRTYSRFLSDKKRREYWWETVRRAVEYNCSLVKTSREEAEELFDNIFNLRQFLSGRTFWIGNTDVSKHYPMANYNCSFQIINDIESFRDIFYLLMIGSGCGVRVRKEDVEQIPCFRGNINLINKEYSPVPKDDRLESTCLQFEDDMAEIVIGDSKEGWVQALDFLLKLLSSFEYRKVKTIIINYDNIRPRGERLKTFGGTASGHAALLTMFKKIHKIVSKTDGLHKLKPIECMDIANIIGEGVVVGGVRRTSEVVLLDSDDDEIIDAKSNLYKQVDGQWIVDKEIIHRQMSNNSIYYTEKPSRERLHWQIEKMRYSGEPAWVNAESASKRRPNFNGVNPLTL